MKKFYSIVIITTIITLVSCYKDNNYLPNESNNGFHVSPLDTMIFADGQSFTYINAEIPIDSKEGKTTISFTTTKGVFENNQKTINKDATIVFDNGNNKRIAQVKLFSTTKIEKAQIDATIGSLTAITFVSFVNVHFDSLFQLSASTDTVVADGESYIMLTATQALDVLEDYTNFTFTTTKGTFENGQKSMTKSSVIVLDSGNYKRLTQVKLISGKKVEYAELDVAIKGTRKKLNVNFTTAYPEYIKLTTSSLTISPGYANSLNFTSTLGRKQGTPSIGTKSDLVVVDSNNKNIGYLINYVNKTDDNGVITNKFTLGNINYHGNIKVIAITNNALNQPVKDSILIISP